MQDPDATDTHTGGSGGSGFLEQKHGFERRELVRIFGLVSRPDLNGSSGRLVRFEVATQRWHLRITATHQIVKIRPINLCADATAPACLAHRDCPEDGVTDVVVCGFSRR